MKINVPIFFCIFGDLNEYTENSFTQVPHILVLFEIEIFPRRKNDGTGKRCLGIYIQENKESMYIPTYGTETIAIYCSFI